MRKLFGALSMIVLVSACGTVHNGQANPSAQPNSTQTPSSVTSPAASLSPPAGFVAADFSGGQVADSGVATVTVGQHDGYDRFVVEFTGGVPSYTVTRQPAATFTRSPRGDMVTLEGSAGVLIVIHSVTNWTSYSGPTAFHPGYPCLRQAMQVENFEGYQQWGLGVQGTPYLRVFTLGSPNRLVVDVAVA